MIILNECVRGLKLELIQNFITMPICKPLICLAKFLLLFDH